MRWMDLVCSLSAAPRAHLYRKALRRVSRARWGRWWAGAQAGGGGLRGVQLPFQLHASALQQTLAAGLLTREGS